MKQTKIDRLTEYYKGQGFTDRQVKNRLKKEQDTEDAEKNQKSLKSMIITIEWKKSQMWGSNPHAHAEIYYADGTYKYADGTYKYADGYTCGGCGYDKESTVIAEIFDGYLRYTLWTMEEDLEKQKSKPYGVSLDYIYNPRFEGGVGTSCYYDIAKFIGGKFEHVASGKTFDVYKFTMNDK